MLTRVTISGADDGVNPADLAALSWRFPFVEWGILFSAKREGTLRYPSGEWRDGLFDAWSVPSGWEMKLSAHFCGALARTLLSGDGDPLDVAGAHFRRAQLNGFSDADPAEVPRLAESRSDVEFILQCKAPLFVQSAAAIARGCKNVTALYDVSGGTGATPLAWPASLLDLRLGYAGGINPDNVLDVLSAIGPVSHDFWIDMESGVRTDDQFDLAKARKVLELTAPYVRRS